MDGLMNKNYFILANTGNDVVNFNIFFYILKDLIDSSPWIGYDISY